MRGMWKRNYGQGIRAPPDERGGNRQTGPDVTARHLYTTVRIHLFTMSRQDQLLASLASGRRLCDDCLSDIAGVTPRQSVYQACTALRDSGLITRMTDACEACNRSKITNARLLCDTRPSAMVSVASPASVGMPALNPSPAIAGQKPWFWEGNVQARIVEHLKEAGISIISSANTSTREQGKDILAKEIDGTEL